jgi:hypothetical protein
MPAQSLQLFYQTRLTTFKLFSENIPERSNRNQVQGRIRLDGGVLLRSVGRRLFWNGTAAAVAATAAAQQLQGPTRDTRLAQFR